VLTILADAAAEMRSGASTSNVTFSRPARLRLDDVADHLAETRVVGQGCIEVDTGGLEKGRAGRVLRTKASQSSRPAS
jgi:hypothetical protein